MKPQAQVISPTGSCSKRGPRLWTLCDSMWRKCSIETPKFRTWTIGPPSCPLALSSSWPQQREFSGNTSGRMSR
uniref:Alternative protein n=1 Tax=Macrostomum lignano TaxID=282301 RepID=A0A1I8G247_9PLAT